jgi:hypothetical protein
MEEALGASKKNVVLLIPWPSLENFGISSTMNLTSITSQVFKLLHSESQIGKGQSKVSIKHLGIAGFSARGGFMLQALEQNIKRVTKKNESEIPISEVYAFDCDKIGSFRPMVVDWARKQGNRLRMTGGYDTHIAVNFDIYKELIDKHKKSLDHVSVYPTNSNVSWEPRKNEWWDYILWWDSKMTPEEDERRRSFREFRHQFAMFGGHGGTDTDPIHKESFFAEFLKSSQF